LEIWGRRTDLIGSPGIARPDPQEKYLLGSNALENKTPNLKMAGHKKKSPLAASAAALHKKLSPKKRRSPKKSPKSAKKSARKSARKH